jgi:glycosyltransferase involved in cell wall biosynthesis
MAVCCLDTEGLWAADLRRDGIAVTALERTAGFHPRLGRLVAQAAARHQANVIHAHHYSPFTYAALARVWSRQLRVIYTEHGRLSDAPPSPKRTLANVLFARLPSEVYAVSHDLRHHIVSEGFPASKVGVVYNGIELQPLPTPADRARVRAELRASDDTLVIGTIARLDSVKDIPTLIDAAARVRERVPAMLVIVGDGAERAALERDAAARGLHDTIRFLGHRDDARAWLAGCDVYANSSIHEGVSLTILEAMSAALPVVATRVGGTPEIVDQECGMLVPARDAASMAAALQSLATAADHRRTLGCAGRRRVEERFTIERMVGEYRDAYYRAARRSEK